MSRRCIIVHFHFFKNAGSSVEHLLEQSFGDRFERFEPGAPTDTFPATVLAPMLEKCGHLQAVSSHTVCFPPPARPEWSVFPIVFLRHPLDRILSMYNYEREQDSQNPGAVAAKAHGPGGYIESRLDDPHESTLRNYQARMLAGQLTVGSDDKALFGQASKPLNRLPVVGVVDEFDESIRQLSRWLSPYFTGLGFRPVRKNRTSPISSRMEDRIKSLRDRIGDDLFERIKRENELDLELYHLARQRLLGAASEHTTARTSAIS